MDSRPDFELVGNRCAGIVQRCHLIRDCHQPRPGLLALRVFTQRNIEEDEAASTQPEQAIRHAIWHWGLRLNMVLLGTSGDTVSKMLER